MRRVRPLAIAALVSLSLGAHAARGADLGVAVTDIQGAEGQVIVRVFADAEAFPRSPERAAIVRFVPINQGRAEVRFQDLAPGRYAVAVAHDENGNGELDFTSWGPPAEGFGFSNNATGLLGPPRFEKAAITLSEPGQSIEIGLRY